MIAAALIANADVLLAGPSECRTASAKTTTVAR